MYAMYKLWLRYIEFLLDKGGLSSTPFGIVVDGVVNILRYCIVLKTAYVWPVVIHWLVGIPSLVNGPRAGKTERTGSISEPLIFLNHGSSTSR